MSTDSFLVFTGVAPHPPIMVPEVGGEAISEVQSSIDAMAEFTRRINEAAAETVVLISPHAPLEADSFVAYSGPNATGNFARFRAPETAFSVPVDEELLSAIEVHASNASYSVSRIQGGDLDHGTAVPLYFLLSNGWQGQIVALGYSFLSNDDHVSFGSCIASAIKSTGRRVAIVASGDLSHRLKPEAPAGYNPHAHVFDDEVVAAINANDLLKIETMDTNVRRTAGECGYRSLLVAIGATKELAPKCELINYEAPFGVGYMVAQLSSDDEVLGELPGLARRAVETYLSTGMRMPTPTRPFGILNERAPCFVSLKTKDGELRGCIGTIEPSKETLAEEIIANAISAASQDPRFDPVTVDELSNLKYSVDVLSAAEETSLDRLNPKIYGVIVEDESGQRRGLLLPDIPGVKDINDQVSIAARKAGIGPGTPIRLYRFEVERYRE